MRLRRLALGAILATFVFAPAVRGGDLDPKDIVANAIKALGGADKLAQAKGEAWKETGTYHIFGMNIAYVAYWTFQVPDKYRFVTEIDLMGQKTKMEFVVNGDKAWQKIGDMQQDLEGAKLADTRHQCYAMHLLSILPLQDKAFTLVPLGDCKLDGKAVVGVKVSSQNRKDVSLFFDPKTGLPAGMATKALDEQTMKEVDQETAIGDYKDIGGRKYFTKVVVKQAGKLTIEATLSDQKSLDKVDPRLFEKP